MDGTLVMLNGRTQVLDAVVSSYPKWDAGIKFLSAEPTFNNTTGIVSLSERLNVTTATATARTVQLRSCTDELVRCVPSDRTIAPCGAGMAPEHQFGLFNVSTTTAYQDVFGSVPIQDVGAVALLALAFVIGFSRGLQS